MGHETAQIGPKYTHWNYVTRHLRACKTPIAGPIPAVASDPAKSRCCKLEGQGFA